MQVADVQMRKVHLHIFLPLTFPSSASAHLKSEMYPYLCGVNTFSYKL